MKDQEDDQAWEDVEGSGDRHGAVAEDAWEAKWDR